eukprot:s906_g7.t1
MVASTHGLLGGGSRVTEPSKVKPASSCKTDDPMKVNLVGNTWLTHFIHFLMPVADYKDCPEAFLAVIEALTEDYKMLCTEGLKVGKHERIWACCLACKGDSPYLVKTGRFERSFYHRPLKAKSKTPGVGVCHMCMAGVESLPDRVEFEEFGVRPSWLRTVEVAAPWTDPPPFLSLPRELDNPNGERFFVFDLFHNWHLGAGKYFVSSSIVHLVNHLGTASNIDARFEALDVEFKAFFKRENLSPHQKNLTKEMFGLQKGVRLLQPDLHIFGHSHFPWDMTLADGVRYKSWPLGTPAEQARRISSYPSKEIEEWHPLPVFDSLGRHYPTGPACWYSLMYTRLRRDPQSYRMASFVADVYCPEAPRVPESILSPGGLIPLEDQEQLERRERYAGKSAASMKREMNNWARAS